MRRGFKNALILLVLIIMFGNAVKRLVASTQWVSYTNREGGYTVSLPGKPMESTRTLRGATGPVELRYVATLAADGSGQYGVAYMEMPPAVLDPRVADRQMELMTHAFSGQMLNKQVISVQGHPGREFTVRRTKGDTTVRLFLAGQRLYQLIVTSPPAETALGAETRNRFMGSFMLLAGS